MLRCSVNIVTEHGHFAPNLPSLCGILFSACSVVNIPWPMTAVASRSVKGDSPIFADTKRFWESPSASLLGGGERPNVEEQHADYDQDGYERPSEPYSPIGIFLQGMIRLALDLHGSLFTVGKGRLHRFYCEGVQESAGVG